MDILLILGISWADLIIKGNAVPVITDEKRSAIHFLDSQSKKLAITLVGATPYGLTDEQRCEMLTSFLIATMRLEGGEA